MESLHCHFKEQEMLQVQSKWQVCPVSLVSPGLQLQVLVSSAFPEQQQLFFESKLHTWVQLILWRKHIPATCVSLPSWPQRTVWSWRSSKMRRSKASALFFPTLSFNSLRFSSLSVSSLVSTVTKLRQSALHPAEPGDTRADLIHPAQ